MNRLVRIHPQVIDGQLVNLLPSQRRAAIRWLRYGHHGVLAGTVEQIDYTRRLIEAEGVPVRYDAPQATGRRGELLVNFRIGEPRRRPVWPFAVGGLVLASGVVVALVILASAIAASIGVIVVAGGLVALAAAVKGGGITQNNYFR